MHPARTYTRRALMVVAIGAALRLATPSAIEFKADEVAALELGIDLIESHPWSSSAPWPRHGMLSSQYIANAPLFNWVMALFWALTHSPIGATAVVAFVNAAALVPFWFWARRWIGDQRALLAVSALAVSPFAVIFSRKLWAQNLLFPGLVLLLWGIEWLRSSRPWRGVVALAFSALIVGQLHQSGPIALALLPIALLIQGTADHRRGHPRLRLGRPSVFEAAALAAALALHLFFWLPYLQYLAGRQDDWLSGRFMVPCCSPDLLRELLRQLVPRGLLYFIDGQDFLKQPMFRSIYYAAIALGIPVAIHGLWRWLRSPLSVPVLGIWWLLIVAAFAAARIRTFQFYLLIMTPLPAMLIAGAFDGHSSSPRLARTLSVLRWSYVATLAALTVVTLVWIAGRGGSPTDYDVSYAVREAQARAALALISAPEGVAPVVTSIPASTELDPSLRCQGIPRQVAWIARWLADRRDLGFEQVQLCDDWRQEDGRIRYRWAVTVVRK